MLQTGAKYVMQTSDFNETSMRDLNGISTEGQLDNSRQPVQKCFYFLAPKTRKGPHKIRSSRHASHHSAAPAARLLQLA
jgi:hypothetical protein